MNAKHMKDVKILAIAIRHFFNDISFKQNDGKVKNVARTSAARTSDVSRAANAVQTYHKFRLLKEYGIGGKRKKEEERRMKEKEKKKKIISLLEKANKYIP